MANIKITDLTAYTAPADTDVLPIVDVGADVTKKVSVGELVGTIAGDVDVATDGTSSIAAGAIVNADVNASAAIAGTKISPNFGSQAVSTTGLISANGRVSFPLGSAAAPSLYPGSDTNTGIYSPGAGQLALSTNGTEGIRINSSGAFGIAGANYGTSGQVLVSSGSNAAPSWGSVLAPEQLTADLDVQTYALYTTTTDGDIDLNADGAGLIKVIEYNLSQVPIVTQHDIGTAPNEIPLNGMLGTMAYQDASSPSVDDLVISAGILVSALPAGPVGMIARVTDANSPAVGSTVAGGGAANALVWYNGSNWTVLGI